MPMPRAETRSLFYRHDRRSRQTSFSVPIGIFVRKHKTSHCGQRTILIESETEIPLEIRVFLIIFVNVGHT